MIWQRIWGGLSSASVGPGSTAESRAFLQKRIAFFGRVGAGLALGSYVFTHASLALEPAFTWRVWLRPDALLYLVNVLLLTGVWLAARGRPRDAPVLAALDGCGSFFACLSASVPLLLDGAT